jgi:mono/diheme cytochrome c family protein
MRRALIVGLALCAVACEQQMQDMYDQPRGKELRPSPVFGDGGSARPEVEGAVPFASGVVAGTSSGRSRAAEAAFVAAETTQPPTTMALLRRGRERFDVYCAPCHSPVGDGDGWITRRGFPHPPSYHIDRLRQADDRHFFDVITQGHGVMLPYANRVTPADRWAIVAYIRALQLSQDHPAEAAR